MAGTTNFPTSADDFATASPTNLGDADSTGRVHHQRHDDAEAALESIEGHLVNLRTDTIEPTGWVDKAHTTLSYNASTRVVTVTAGASGAVFWSGGVRYSIGANVAKTVTHTNVTGTHFVYFDSSTTLQVSTSAWTIDSTTVPTCAVYYNATAGAGVLFDERHGCTMDAATHKNLHQTRGSQIVSGFGISGYTLSPTSPSDAANDFDVATGVVADEDLQTTVPALSAGASAYRVWWRTGASGDWTWDTTTLPFTVGTTYVHYNQNTGSTWQKTELGNNNWVNMWVLATPSLTANHGLIVVMGQAVHTALVNAQAEAFSALALGTSPAWTEFAAVWRVTYRMSSGYTGATGRCRVESVTRVVGTAVSVNQTNIGSHAALSGLTGADVHPASSISADTTNFAGNLTVADDTVQKALDTLDNLTVSATAGLSPFLLMGS